jgi:hypothetical protein
MKIFNHRGTKTQKVNKMSLLSFLCAFVPSW